MLSIFKLNSDVNYESSYFIKIWMPSQTFICLLLLVVVGHRRRPLHHIVTYLRVAYPTKAHVSCIVRALIKIRIIRKRSVSSVFIRPCENERNEGGGGRTICRWGLLRRWFFITITRKKKSQPHHRGSYVICKLEKQLICGISCT